MLCSRMYRYVAVTHHHRFNNSDWSLLFDVSIEYNEKWLAEFFGAIVARKWNHDDIFSMYVCCNNTAVRTPHLHAEANRIGKIPKWPEKRWLKVELKWKINSKLRHKTFHCSCVYVNHAWIGVHLSHRSYRRLKRNPFSALNGFDRYCFSWILSGAYNWMFIRANKKDRDNGKLRDRETDRQRESEMESENC